LPIRKLVPISRAYTVGRPREGQHATDGEEFDGPVQEQATGLPMATGVDVRPEIFGVAMGMR
jgi:hypothetical protein